MKKILLSLGVIAIVAVGAIGATRSFFSDTETSTGNTFTAGAIDLTVDSTQHYNGNVCVWDANVQDAQGVIGHWIWNGPIGSYPTPGNYCDGSWLATDLGAANKFFDFADIKPGDSGEDTISLHVLNNDAWVCAAVSGLTDFENNQTEPEAQVDSTTGTNQGELSQTMNWKVWRDDGVSTDPTGNPTGKCDNIWQPGEAVLAEGHPTNGTLALYDSTTHIATGALTGPLTGDSTSCLGVAWSLPEASGNETQTDSLTGDISFSVVQSRNNTNFKCSSLHY